MIVSCVSNNGSIQYVPQAIVLLIILIHCHSHLTDNVSSLLNRLLSCYEF
uniref:Uncharacterized protein n=1 Tax=Rhizophora mucronata TaxID=61149 RepID=A0A2P2Q3R1_RHIMU